MTDIDKQIGSLTINALAEKLANEAAQCATYKSLYEIVENELKNMQAIIDSDEELKAKFEEAKGKMENGSK